MALKVSRLCSFPWVISMSCKCTPPVTRTRKQTAGMNETNTDRATRPNAHQSKRGSKALPSCMKERMFNFNHQGQKKLWPAAMTLLFSHSDSAESKSRSHPSVQFLALPLSEEWDAISAIPTRPWSPAPHSSEQLPTEAQQNHLTRQRRQTRARELKPKQSH